MGIEAAGKRQGHLPGDHDVEQKKSRRLPLCVWNDVGRGVMNSRGAKPAASR